MPTPAAETSTLVPVADLAATEAQKVNKPWTGDFNELGERRFIRALVVINKTSYLVDRADQRGIAYESLADLAWL
jgi:hypothetical protein